MIVLMVIMFILGLTLSLAMLAVAFSDKVKTTVVNRWQRRGASRASTAAATTGPSTAVPPAAPTSTVVTTEVRLAQVICAAFAWFPMFLFTYLVWPGPTDSYPVAVMLLLEVLTVGFAAVAKVKNNNAMMKAAAVFGTIMVLIAVFETDWTNVSSREETIAEVLPAPKFTAKQIGDKLEIRLDASDAGYTPATAQFDWTVTGPVPSDNEIDVLPDDDSQTVTVPEAGAYKVTLVITDKEGTPTKPATKRVTVSGDDAPPPTGCSATWEYVTDVPINYAVVNGGLESIRNASNREEAQAAARDWVNQMKLERNKLSYAIKLVLDEDVEPDALASGTCANDKAAAYVPQLIGMLDRSYIVPDQAPENGTNTGREEVEIVASAEPGITGDRTAIKVVLPDGRIFWILGRCGNPVFIGEVDLPTGKTDQVVQVTPTTQPAPPAPTTAPVTPNPTPAPPSNPTTPTSTTPPKTTPPSTPPAPPVVTTPPPGKNAEQETVGSDSNAAVERDRPYAGSTGQVTPTDNGTPSGGSTSGSSPSSSQSAEDVPENSNPAPVNGDGSEPPLNSGDLATTGDTSGDGIPD